MHYIRRVVRSCAALCTVMLFISFGVFSATKLPQYPARYVESGQYVVKLKQVMEDQEASAMLTKNLQEQGQKLNISSATQAGVFSGFRLKSMFPSMQAKALASRSLQDKQNASPLSRTYLMFMPESTMTRDDVLNIVSEIEGVEAVEPVFIYSTGVADEQPNQPLIQSSVTAGERQRQREQYHLEMFQLPEARAFLASQEIDPGGSEDVIVAVIDTGLDFEHPEFEGRLWVNAREIPDNGRDDDFNGVVDDVNGANFVGDATSGDIRDFYGHGTHVAGIVAANDDGQGVTGVAPNVQIMAVRASQTNGRFLSADIAEGIIYAHENGADVINMSFGGPIRSFVVEDALALAFTTTSLVAAAGNSGVANELSCSPDAVPSYPAVYDYVIGVMAHNSANELADFSNTDCDARTLFEYELAAPGVDIVSTVPDQSFSPLNGTSMSSPMVAGAAALLRSFYSDRTLYTSRFIMAQLVGTAENRTTPNDARVRLLNALTEAPLPDITVLDSHIFDTNELSLTNDVDGRVDAGETIALGVTLKNHWGSASDVTVTLVPRPAVGAPLDDPFVEIVVGEANMGDIGNFGSLNSLVVDGNGQITGVSSGFVFNISADTPNNYVLTFSILVRATDGNGNEYVEPLDGVVDLTVNQRQALPAVIREDRTLTSDRLWLVECSVLIEEGARVTVQPGTQIQFFTSDPTTLQSGPLLAPRLVVNGEFVVRGSAANPVRIFPSGLYSSRNVEIQGGATGRVDMEFVELVNPSFPGGIQRVDHGSVTLLDERLSFAVLSSDWQVFNTTNTIFGDIGSRDRSLLQLQAPFFQSFQNNLFLGTADSLTSNRGLQGNVSSIIGNVFLRNIDTPNNALPINVPANSIDNVRRMSLNNVGRPAVRDSFFILDPLHVNNKTYVPITWTLAGFFWYLGSTNHVMGTLAIADALGGHPVSINTNQEYRDVTGYLEDLSRDLANGVYDRQCGGSCDGILPETSLNDDELAVLLGWEQDSQGEFAWLSGETSISSILLDQFNDLNLNNFIQSATYQITPSFGNRFATDHPDLALYEIEGIVEKEELEARFEEFELTTYNQFYDNAILNYWWSPDPAHWMSLSSSSVSRLGSGLSNIPDDQPGDPRVITNNYWAGVSDALIQQSLLDFDAGNFEGYRYVFEPVLETPPENTFPFVADVRIDTQAASDVTQFGVEPITLTLTFNRDMDRSIQPGVFFAPNAPYTDREVLGDWISDRQWQAQYDVPPTIEGGFQYLSVFNAVSEDDPWLRSGNDFARFRFLVSTSGTLSTSQLNAQNLEAGVLVEWDIDNTNFNVINLFRSTDPNDNFRLVHRTYRNSTDNTFVDTSVTDNTEYFYQLSVGLEGEETLVSQTARIVRDSTDVSDPDDGNPSAGGGTLAVPYDFDGDGAADVAVRRPSNFMQFIRNSSDEGIQRIAFGRNPNDIPISGDFDGDGITDVGVRRASNQTWFILNSSGQDLISGNADGITRMRFGLNAADIPVPADYDGDGITDLAVRRPSNQTWFVRNSSGVDEVTGNSDGITRLVFGRNAQDIPVVADYDGDGRADFAVRRPSTQMWFIRNSSGVDVLTGFNDGISRRRFGTQEEDIPVPADFDGDGRADLAVRRPSTESWFVLNSSGSNFNSSRNDGIQRVTFGRNSADIPIVADYDGDGIADFAVRRPSNQMQFILHSSDDEIGSIRFGLQSTDIPLAAPVQTRMQMARGAQ